MFWRFIRKIILLDGGFVVVVVSVLFLCYTRSMSIFSFLSFSGLSTAT